jgi:hypothetical protein
VAVNFLLLISKNRIVAVNFLLLISKNRIVAVNLGVNAKVPGHLETSPSKAVAAAVDDDPAEPGIEPAGIAQSEPLSPRRSKRVLGRFFGIAGVAENRPSQSIGRLDVPGR